MSERFDFIKPVEGHPDEICCTECWQRGISWGSAGRTEEIIELLQKDAGYCNQTKPMNEHVDDYCNCRLIALIEGENQKDNETISLLPTYHCPDCNDWDCLHCYCVDEPDCNACVDFAKSEGENK